MTHGPTGCHINLLYGGEEHRYELQTIKYELHPNGVAVCTYNTPNSLNSLSQNQQWETYAILEHMTKDDNVRVAIWTGAGEKAFNSGADLKDQKVFIPKEARPDMEARGMAPVKGDFVLAPMTKAFWDFPKPSIVAVNGLAVGGAANIALCNFHDLVICSTNARFMYPFPKLGFTPELGSSVMMPFTIGMARAKELMLLGDWLSAEKAEKWGLVNAVVAPDQLMTEAMKLAERLVMFHPEPLKLAKKVLNHHVRTQLDSILMVEQETIMASLTATGGPPAVAKWMKEKKEQMDQLKSKL